MAGSGALTGKAQVNSGALGTMGKLGSAFLGGKNDLSGACLRRVRAKPVELSVTKVGTK